MERESRLCWAMGLLVWSMVKLPGARPAVSDARAAELLIEQGPAPERLGTGVRLYDICEATEDAVLFHLPGDRRILVENGCHVTCDGFSMAQESQLGYFLRKTVLPVVLLQRRALLLHASAVTGAGQARLFCGHSGAGKSTTAAALGQQGYPVTSDDVSQLHPDADGNFMIWPEGAPLRLDRGSRDHLGLPSLPTVPNRPQPWKEETAPTLWESEIRPVGSIYILTIDQMARSPFLRPMGPVEARAAISRESHGLALIEHLSLRRDHEALLGALIATTPVYALHRPVHFSSLERMLEVLKEQWAKTATA